MAMAKVQSVKCDLCNTKVASYAVLEFHECPSVRELDERVMMRKNRKSVRPVRVNMAEVHKMEDEYNARQMERFERNVRQMELERANVGTNNIVVGGQVWPILVKQKPVECEQPPNGMSVPSITYNGETYYKDSEGFIYKRALPNNDIPIGFWKNKAQSITFY